MLHQYTLMTSEVKAMVKGNNVHNKNYDTYMYNDVRTDNI